MSLMDPSWKQIQRRGQHSSLAHHSFSGHASEPQQWLHLYLTYMHGLHITPRLPPLRTERHIHTTVSFCPPAALTHLFMHKPLQPPGAFLFRRAYAMRTQEQSGVFCNLPKQASVQMQESWCCGGIFLCLFSWVSEAAVAECTPPLTLHHEPSA